MMKGKFTEILCKNKLLSDRKEVSNKKIADLQLELNCLFEDVDSKDRFFCFCAGSLARGDCGTQSDLDVFMIYDGEDNFSSIDKYRIYGHIIYANKKMDFPDLSNDGQYLQMHSFSEMEKTLGDPKDDYFNLFTTRMLLLLESKVVFNSDAYDRVLRKVIGLYFRDKNTSGSGFLPMFLLNDILRYWRTMCLNYETIRNDKNRPWRKKNINLKFSRMLSVYSAVIPAVLGYARTEVEWIELCLLPPLERIAKSLDKLDDLSFLDKFSDFLNAYCSFLQWKDMPTSEVVSFFEKESNKCDAKERAEMFSDLFYSILSHDCVDHKMKKFIAI